MLFSLQFHGSPTMIGLKMFQTVFNLCFVGRVYSRILSNSKL